RFDAASRLTNLPRASDSEPCGIARGRAEDGEAVEGRARNPCLGVQSDLVAPDPADLASPFL
ncbi:MAG: hypothetical protein VX077_07910, partial [Pseudomonadota bacterium]|nr:hypothetical protein [Pseudomonadota bacterium]